MAHESCDEAATVLPSPAFYAARQGGGWRDWWTLLHPPYTAWHVSYAVLGGTLVSPVDWHRVAASGSAFFLAVGVGAHAFDELHGRPLRTAIPGPALVAVGTASLAAAALVGTAGGSTLPWVAAGTLLVVGYNFELFGGLLHNDVGFAAGWGAFPVLAAAVVQPAGVGPATVLAAGGAFALSLAQRRLSTPARQLRRRTRRISGEVQYTDGRRERLDVATLLDPLEGALRATAWAVSALAAAVALARAVSDR